MLSKEELQNLSQLLLSVDERNLEIAFELLKQGGLAEKFVSELFAVYKMDVKSYSYAAKQLLEGVSSTIKGLPEALKGRAYLNSSTSSSNIKKYTKLCPAIDPKKLALAIYNKYDSGFQYLFSELSEEELKPILDSKIEHNVLTLSRKTITKIPKALLAYEKLEEINWPYNQVKSLPTGIHQLKALRKLNLRSNEVKKLHKNIGKLKHLEVLELDWNKLESLPDELANLTSLKELRLGYNSFKEFPSVITQIPNLEKLSIGRMMDFYVDVSEIPATFFDLKTDRLIELTLREPTDSNSRKPWGNLPVITRITGTYEDPISTKPLDIARRAFDQNKEAMAFLLREGTAADKLKVYNFILQDKITSEKYAHHLGTILKDGPSEIKKRALSFYIRNEVLFFDKKIRLSVLPPELERFSITEMEWVGAFSEITNYQTFWDFLKYTPSIKRLIIGKDVTSSETQEINLPVVMSKLTVLKFGRMKLNTTSLMNSLEKLPALEVLQFEAYFFLKSLAEVDDLLRTFAPLKSCSHLTELTIGSFYNSNKKELEDEALMERLESGFKALLPTCKVYLLQGS